MIILHVARDRYLVTEKCFCKGKSFRAPEAVVWRERGSRGEEGVTDEITRMKVYGSE